MNHFNYLNLNLNLICQHNQSNHIEFIHRAFNNHTYYLDDCLQQLFLVVPIHLIALAYISYWLGTIDYHRLNRSKSSQIQRIVSSILFILLLTSNTILLSAETDQILLKKCSYLLKIFVIIVYICLYYQQSISRFTRYLLALITIVSISECLTNYCDKNVPIFEVILLFTIIICWTIHILSLFTCTFNNDDHELLIEDNNDHEEIALKHDENHSLLVQVLFLWVTPLLDKSKLNSHEELFRLPVNLLAESYEQSIDSYLSAINDHLMLKTLIHFIFRGYYLRFLTLFLLKIIADSMNLLFPIFLNRLLLYLDDNNLNHRQSYDGFYFAIGILACSAVNVLIISYYNFQMNKLSLRIRTKLILLLYRKLFTINGDKASMNTGHVLNLANTDVERVVNVISSLIQFITLPLQLLVTIYLLYAQIGLAFIAAILFIVILIPINKWICDKIKHLSEQLMAWKDRRISVINECLKQIRQIKFHSWESIFQVKINQLRSNEIRYLKYRKYLDALCVYFWATTPVIISSLVFCTFVWLNDQKQLTSDKVFTTLALLSMLIMPLNALPWVLNGLVESIVSLKRLNQFYLIRSSQQQQPQQQSMIFDDDQNNNSLLFRCINCTFQYNDNAASSTTTTTTGQQFQLKIIDFTLNNGDHIAITGRVGSGKSTMAKCLLNELTRINGQILLNRKYLSQGIGYASQEPWIIDDTIRNNILFGHEFDQEWYAKIIDSCELIEDFKTFKYGDQTMIGNHGQTLSGGQKTRVQLARVLYQNFDMYIVDEPFATLDQHVARKIYRKCFQELLNSKTVVLITNHLEYLQQDRMNKFQIYYMSNGTLINRAKIESNSGDNSMVRNEIPSDPAQSEPKQCQDDQQEPAQQEQREHGHIKLKIYSSYMRSIGYTLSAVIIVFICLMQISKSSSDFWLSKWTNDLKMIDSNQQSQSQSFDTMYYLYIFITIGIVNSIITLIRAFSFAYGGIRAAIIVHNRLLSGLFQSSIIFFDIFTFGLIMNRFSSDVYNVDDALPFTLNIFLSQISALIIGLFVTAYGIPWIIIVFIGLAIPYYLVQEYYRRTSRELKRISATTLSPIYSQLDDTIRGLIMIRAFGHGSRFESDFNDRINVYNRVQYAIYGAQQWLNLRLQMLGTIITASVAFLAVYLHFYYYYHNQVISASLIGLSLVYSLSLTNLLNGSFQTFAQTELELISMERIEDLWEKLMQFNEDQDESSSSSLLTICNDWNQLSIDWPIDGRIEFENVSMRYRNDLPLALKNVSFKIDSGEHVAIVGRTGSGKSSIFQLLFRMVEPETGTIRIDGIDIRTIDRHWLRSRMHIVPQDVFIFNGTIRENLDPTLRFTDEEIWQALFDCKINILIDKLGGLQCMLNDNENGTILSIGQRHLFCLARCLLHRTKIICMDEIMANIDDETGTILNELMQTIFKQTTIIHIAHKYESIANCNRIIRLNDGQIME